MAKVWKVVAIICVILLILSVALVAVAYATGGSVNRLIQTTDIFDMTKFISRERLEDYVSMIPGIVNE